MGRHCNRGRAWPEKRDEPIVTRRHRQFDSVQHLGSPRCVLCFGWWKRERAACDDGRAGVWKTCKTHPFGRELRSLLQPNEHKRRLNRRDSVRGAKSGERQVQWLPAIEVATHDRLRRADTLDRERPRIPLRRVAPPIVGDAARARNTLGQRYLTCRRLTLRERAADDRRRDKS